tara:strand:+ start:44 stop:379 length:336 start_codon:yes stop_codon:yes gene_type:complete
MAIHTIRKTNKIIAIFKEHCNLDFVDNSYKNDEADSLHFPISESATEHNYIEVYLPHVSIGYKDYFITNQDREELLLTENICEVIEFMNEQDFTSYELCRNGKLIKDCNCC